MAEETTQNQGGAEISASAADAAPAASSAATSTNAPQTSTPAASGTSSGTSSGSGYARSGGGGGGGYGGGAKRPYAGRSSSSGGSGGRGERPSGGGAGAGGAGGRKFFRRKKVCKFCAEKIDAISYRDQRLLQGFVAERGKIVPRRLTGVCTKHQRRLTRAIKQARNIALLPFSARF
jgi:small subunit ribosomal protein S18